MADPLKHIVRPPLPWRESDQTRCGRSTTEIRPELLATLDEAKQIVAQHGKQRAAFLFCMTCAQGASPWREWDDDPIERMGRECSSLSHYGIRRDPERAERFERELRTMALLIEAHRDEWEATLASFDDDAVVSLADRRRATR